MSVPVTMTLSGKQLTVFGRRQQGFCRRAWRSVALLGVEGGADHDRGAAKIAAARSPTHKRGAQPASRWANWNGSSGSWNGARSKTFPAKGVDAAVVLCPGRPIATSRARC